MPGSCCVVDVRFLHEERVLEPLRDLEVDELGEWPQEHVARTRPDHQPFVMAFPPTILASPAQVRDAEIDRASYAGELRVIDKDDAAHFEEPTRVDEVEEHPFEAVVAIDEDEVELLPSARSRGRRICDSSS